VLLSSGSGSGTIRGKMPIHLPRRKKPTTAGEAAGPAPVKGNAATGTTLERDLLIVTYAVPATRVRAHLPEGLSPDLLPGPDGEPLAFLQTLCAYHEDARWSPLPGFAGTSFHQVAYRILTRRAGKRGVFILRTFVSTSELHATKRAIAREADYARFTFFIDGDPARNANHRYHIRAVGDLGQTNLEVKALPEPPPVPAPFGKAEDMVTFLTQREENYFKASVPKNAIGLSPTRHDPLSPAYGELAAARLTPWTELKLLTPDELLHPLAVYLQAALTVYAYPPRLVRLND